MKKSSSLLARSGKKAPRLLAGTAQQLHDGPCQTLTAVQLLAKVTLRKMEAGDSPHLPAMRELTGLLQRAREELAAILQPRCSD